MNRFFLCLILFWCIGLAGCVPRDETTLLSESDDVVFVQKTLKIYCKSCHGIGNYKFYTSNDPKALLQGLSQTYSYHDNSKTWRQGIIDAINWGDTARPKSPRSDAKWMPIGSKMSRLESNNKVRLRLIQILSNKAAQRKTSGQPKSKNSSSTLVGCRKMKPGYALFRKIDKKQLGKTISQSDCNLALKGMNSGVICTHTLYQSRKGWAPTIIGNNSVAPRATGHEGVSDLKICNRMIQHADKLIVCSYSGSTLGWKTTRTYRIPAEPARYPHRFSSSNRSLDDCLKVAAGSLVVWQKKSNYLNLTHQSCGWGGTDWYPVCAVTKELRSETILTGGAQRTPDECVRHISKIQKNCIKKADNELKFLKTIIESQGKR